MPFASSSKIWPETGSSFPGGFGRSHFLDECDMRHFDKYREKNGVFLDFRLTKNWNVLVWGSLSHGHGQ